MSVGYLPFWLDRMEYDEAQSDCSTTLVFYLSVDGLPVFVLAASWASRSNGDASIRAHLNPQIECEVPAQRSLAMGLAISR